VPGGRLMPLCLALCLSEVWSAGAVEATPQAPAARRDLTELSLAELTTLEVTSVSRRPEEWARAAAAIYVITEEEIRRSGARTVPELLRTVAGVDVARISSSQWAIGVRGFTSNLARAQLVLLDGRSLYTPLFAGTYWDVQNLVLEDVARIEVIRGPGGPLWGANAVNGVINIITKKAQDTLGGLAAVGGGNQERGFGRARHGGRLGGRGAYRVYGRYFHRAAEHQDATEGFDDWDMLLGGFRADWDLRAADTFTLQGDLYGGRAGRRTTIASYERPFMRTVEQDADLGGGNLRAAWTRSLPGRRQVSVQAYYDRTEREEANFREDRDTWDLDVQYAFPLPGRQDVVAGAAYRASQGRTGGVPTVVFDPAQRTDDLVSAFVQDSIELVPERLRLVIGSKMERNDYTGFELQPTARLSWSPPGSHAFWGAVTRAVRTPSRLERDLSLAAALSAEAPVFARVLGTDAFDTERTLAYEAGYRGRFSQRLFLDVAGFHNRYPNLSSLEPGAPFLEPGRQILPFRFGNGLEGRATGLELMTDFRPSTRWVVRVGYDYLNLALRAKAGSADTTSAAAEDNSPRHHVSVRSSLTLPRGLLADGALRWVARRPTNQVPAYVELDLRVAWRPRDRLELAAVGRDLLHARHQEFGGTTRIKRSVYGEAIWRW
jgi:iron complex outermembrane recepter protein